MRRRGAKPAVEDEEEDDDEAEEEERGGEPGSTSTGTGPGGQGDDSLSDESDFDPDSGREDDLESEEDEDESDDEAEDDDDPREEEEARDRKQKRGMKSNGHSNGATTTRSTPFDQEQKAMPAAWSDMPEVGQAGSNQLPELDFAGLSVSKLEDVPAASERGDKKLSRKERLQQSWLEKNKVLKEKDPQAWEKLERERKETEEARYLALKEKKKEKKKARKVAQREKRQVETTTNGTEAAASTTDARPTPVPARPSKTAVALGLANSSDSPVPAAPTSASTSRQQTASTSNGPRSTPSSRPARPPHANALPLDYTRAREAYTQRLASDPAYIPKVGKFWGHDDRLASPEVRPLNPFWRGGRGAAGGRGRGGAGRGGRGGSAAQRGPDRWTADGRIAGEQESDAAAAEDGDRETRVGDERPQEIDPEDKWGRGESKRAPKPSEFASMPGWNHAGFEELEREEEERAARGPSTVTRGAKRGGRGATRGKGGFSGRGGTVQGPPGSINPRYAHLPFHPLHRFPPAALPASQAAETNTESSTSELPLSKEASPAAESATTVESTGATHVASPNRPGNVRLPSSGVAAAQFALAVKEATATRPKQDEPVPEPVNVETQPQGIDESPSTDAQPPNATSPTLELRKQQGASILYAADPSRLASSVPREDAVSPASSFSAYQQQMEPAPLPVHNPYQHQLPPHLQSQAAFIPRHSSPSFYPGAGPPPPSFYPIDSYSAMPSPSSATPPPQHFSSPPTSSFFLPPRSSRVEIKNPSSPAPPRQTVVSTNNTAYAIASQQQQQQLQEYGHPGSPDPKQDSVPLPPASPILHGQPMPYYHNPYSSETPPLLHSAHYGYSQLQPPHPSFSQHQQHYEVSPLSQAHYFTQYSQHPPPPQHYSYYPQTHQYAPY